MPASKPKTQTNKDSKRCECSCDKKNGKQCTCKKTCPIKKPIQSGGCGCANIVMNN
jgi:hypothetical protein